jgi:hypothetical protein
MFIYYKMSEEIIGDEALRKREMQLRGESWNDQHETILRQWGEASGSYRYMHHRAFLMYKKLSMRFTLPVIVLSTITGTANFAQEQFPESVRGMVPSVIGGLNLIAGLIATIMQFLKINELMENHKAAALSYGLLSRNIRLTLALAREERNQDGLDFVNNAKTEYDRLIEQSPAIPTNILVMFEKEYPLDNVFTKPEILDVRAIPKLRIDKPKTINTVTAITKGGPLEGVGKLLEPKTPPPSVTSDLEEGEIRDEQGTQ